MLFCIIWDLIMLDLLILKRILIKKRSKIIYILENERERERIWLEILERNREHQNANFILTFPQALSVETFSRGNMASLPNVLFRVKREVPVLFHANHQTT